MHRRSVVIKLTPKPHTAAVTVSCYCHLIFRHFHRLGETCAEYRKSAIFGDPWPESKTPGGIAMKLGVRNYVVDPTLTCIDSLID